MVIIIKDIQDGYTFKVVKMMPYKRVPKSKKIKKNTDSYKSELIFMNAPVFVLEEYAGCDVKIFHECKICGYNFPKKPSDVLRGQFCPKCARKKSCPYKTPDQYVKDLSEKNPNFIVLEDYVDNKTKIKHKCLICNYEFLIAPIYALNGNNCPKCAISIRSQKRMSTNDEYIDKLLQKYTVVFPIENYKGALNKILHVDLSCGHIFSMSPANVLSGERCPYCVGIRLGEKFLKTHDEYLAELQNSNINIYPKEKYKGAYVKILHVFPCGHEYLCSPMSILKYHSCIICSSKNRGLNQRKNHADFIKELSSIHPHIEILSEYVLAKEKINCRCLICSLEFKASPTSLLRGTGCPQCKIPKGEKRISSFLDNNSISYTIQKKYNNLIGNGGRRLSYDFYLSSHNLLIEFQGAQHERPIEHFGGEEQFKIQQEHDRRKREYAKEHNIDLLEIWYYDYDNIEDILTNYLNLETVETVIPA